MTPALLSPSVFKPATHLSFQIFTPLFARYNSAHSVEPCEIYHLANILQIILGIPTVICIRQNCLSSYHESGSHCVQKK